MLNQGRMELCENVLMSALVVSSWINQDLIICDFWHLFDRLSHIFLVLWAVKQCWTGPCAKSTWLWVRKHEGLHRGCFTVCIRCGDSVYQLKRKVCPVCSLLWNNWSVVGLSQSNLVYWKNYCGVSSRKETVALSTVIGRIDKLPCSYIIWEIMWTQMMWRRIMG